MLPVPNTNLENTGGHLLYYFNFMGIFDCCPLVHQCVQCVREITGLVVGQIKDLRNGPVCCLMVSPLIIGTRSQNWQKDPDGVFGARPSALWW
jgi:hypothetical protein